MADTSTQLLMRGASAALLITHTPEIAKILGGMGVCVDIRMNQMR